jgi:uncharacterized surface protein with fasciclin (FAS1) repeats
METEMTRLMKAAAIALVVAAPLGSASAQDATDRNIVEVAVGTGQFTTLVAAVNAAGLGEILMGKGPFTVFAPTDAAFAKLPAGTVEALLADREKLTKILTYHVIPGKVTSGDIVAAGGASAATVNGQQLSVVLRDGKVYVGNAQVIAADVGASNGVIHVIDTVLLPE